MVEDIQNIGGARENLNPDFGGISAVFGGVDGVWAVCERYMAV